MNNIVEKLQKFYAPFPGQEAAREIEKLRWIVETLKNEQEEFFTGNLSQKTQNNITELTDKNNELSLAIHKNEQEIKKYKYYLEKLRERILLLEQALKPFADEATLNQRFDDDDYPISRRHKVGDLRRAFAVLNKNS